MLTLYGVDASQPCRSVSWLLRLNNKEFTYEHIFPGAKRGGSRDPAFINGLNKDAKVPVLKHGDFILQESNAILVYLCEVFKWEKYYPLGNDVGSIQRRGRINRFLHWHHTNSREFTLGIFAPLLRPDLKFTPEVVKQKQKQVANVAKVLDGYLEGQNFLVDNQVSIADLACFADIGQLSREHLNLFDFAPYPNVQRWIGNMMKLPHYEETHAVLDTLKGAVDAAKKSADAQKIQSKM